MLFGTNHRLARLDTELSVTAGDIELEQVPCFKYVGLHSRRTCYHTGNKIFAAGMSPCVPVFSIIRRLADLTPISARVLE